MRGVMGQLWPLRSKARLHVNADSRPPDTAAATLLEALAPHLGGLLLSVDTAEASPVQGWIGVAARHGLPVQVRGGGHALRALAPLVAREAIGARGVLPGAAVEPLCARVDTLRPALAAVRGAAGAPASGAGPVPVQIVGLVHASRLPELPMLVHSAGPLRPKRISLWRDSSPASSSPLLEAAIAEALVGASIEAKRIGCRVDVQLLRESGAFAHPPWCPHEMDCDAQGLVWRSDGLWTCEQAGGALVLRGPLRLEETLAWLRRTGSLRARWGGGGRA